MNKLHAVILASVMVSSLAFANQPTTTTTVPVAPAAAAPAAAATEGSSFWNTCTSCVSSVTTPVRNHPYISGTVALVAVAAFAYYLMNTEDNEEEEAQF